MHHIAKCLTQHMSLKWNFCLNVPDLIATGPSPINIVPVVPTLYKLLFFHEIIHVFAAIISFIFPKFFKIICGND